jgi:cobalamin biosynthesis Co2+ chelatase CbiK
MTFISPDDELDPMEDADDELEIAGMHVLGEDADEEDEEVKTLLDTIEVPVEDEEPKDGLAELEEMEKAYLNDEDEAVSDDEEEMV